MKRGRQQKGGGGGRLNETLLLNFHETPWQPSGGLVTDLHSIASYMPPQSLIFLGHDSEATYTEHPDWTANIPVAERNQVSGLYYTWSIHGIYKAGYLWNCSFDPTTIRSVSPSPRVHVYGEEVPISAHLLLGVPLAAVARAGARESGLLKDSSLSPSDSPPEGEKRLDLNSSGCFFPPSISYHTTCARANTWQPRAAPFLVQI